MLQFQYLSLIRYGAMMHQRFNQLRSSFKLSKEENLKLLEDLRELELTKIALNEDVENLQLFKKKYMEYKKHEAEITGYLQRFTEVAE